MRIGFIGILKEAFQADAEGTLAWLGSLGIDGMEGAAAMAGYFNVGLPEARERLEGAGLKAGPQGRVAFEQAESEWREVMATATAMGTPYVVDYYAPCNNRDEILRYCDYFNAVGRICREEGLRFLYHNHDHEFRRIPDTTAAVESRAPADSERTAAGTEPPTAFDIILDNTDPELVGIELDVAWATFGGYDPVVLIPHHAPRIPVLHMKDFEQLHPGSATAEGKREEAVFTEVGTGVVDTAGVVAAAREADIDWLIIEQDRMNRLSPKESLEVSFGRLRGAVITS